MSAGFSQGGHCGRPRGGPRRRSRSGRRTARRGRAVRRRPRRRRRRPDRCPAPPRPARRLRRRASRVAHEAHGPHDLGAPSPLSASAKSAASRYSSSTTSTRLPRTAPGCTTGPASGLDSPTRRPAGAVGVEHDFAEHPVGAELQPRRGLELVRQRALDQLAPIPKAVAAAMFRRNLPRHAPCAEALAREAGSSLAAAGHRPR